MPDLDKVIVTNGAAFRRKYGTGFDLDATLKPLLDGDRRRGLTTRVVDLSRAGDMGRVGGSAVSKARDARQTKAAVDAVFKKLRPHYVLILGSVDVVAQQSLRNPTPDDGDPEVPTDLPYACESAYSSHPKDFRARTTHSTWASPRACGGPRPRSACATRSAPPPG